MQEIVYKSLLYYNLLLFLVSMQDP